MDVIKAERWKMIELALRRPGELRNKIIKRYDGVGNKTARRPRHSRLGQIKNYEWVEISENLKEKVSNRIERWIGVVNRPMNLKKKKS